MQTLSKGSSAQVYWEDLVFLEAALLASPDTAALAGAVTEVLAEYEGLQARKLAVRRAQLQARARASVADAMLDGGLRSLRNAALFLVQHRRDDPAYRALFKGTLEDEIKHALRRQVEVAQQKVDALSLQLFDEAFRQANRPGLMALVEQGRAVLQSGREASFAAADHKLTEDAWKEEVAAVRQAVYGQLMTLGAQKGLGKKWAEAFFDGGLSGLEDPSAQPAGAGPGAGPG
jgi:hypothetical protein